MTFTLRVNGYKNSIHVAANPPHHELDCDRDRCGQFNAVDAWFAVKEFNENIASLDWQLRLAGSRVVGNDHTHGFVSKLAQAQLKRTTVGEQTAETEKKTP